jgi:hypothetical protein
MHFRTAWNDFFTGSPTLTQNKEYQTQQNPTDTSVYISNCLFISITSTSSGGALSCSTSVSYFLAESSSFLSCKASSAGGAIYFSNTNSGECVLHKVCGYDCCTTGSAYAQFARIYANRKNYINYSSFTRSVNEYSGSWYLLELSYGNIICPSVNSSMNKCYSRTGIYCDSSSCTSLLSYSSYADNNATYHTCVRIYYGGEIKSCNIIRNTQVSLDSEGTICTYGNVKIENSCILGNVATYVFRQQSSSSYTITISNCTVDTTSNNGFLTIQNTVTKSFINALDHVSTRNCQSEYDLVGSLSAFLSPTKKVVCYTCKVYHCQASISSFFNLNLMFMVTFR